MWVAHRIKESLLKILITGGAGFVGTELIASLCKSKYISEIICYDNFSRNNFTLFTQPSLNAINSVKVIQGDILDSRKLKKSLNNVDTVVHLAANVSTPYSFATPHAYDQINNWGTAELVYAIENSKVKSFIHLSTTAIYGFSDKSINEKAVPLPVNSYGISKLRGEKHVRRLMKNDKLQTVILRSGNIFGYSPSMRFESVINKFVFDAKYLGKIHVDGEGKQVRPFICITELVNVIESFIFQKTKPEDGIYNVFSDNIRIIDIATFIKSLYSTIDIQYLNQCVKYGSLILQPNKVINGIVGNPTTTVYDKIKNMSESLSFGSIISSGEKTNGTCCNTR